MTKSNDHVRRCMWCGNHGISKEDVIPRWIGRLLRDTDHDESNQASATLHKETANRPSPGSTTIHRHSRIGLASGPRVPVVCANCNSGWMSELERDVQPIITNLVIGKVPDQGVILSAHDLRTISSWATKTALVHDVSNQTPVVTTDDTRKRFFETREPPLGAEIWIGGYHAPTGFMWKLDQCVLAQGELGDRDDLCLVTITLRHLIVQVWMDFRLSGTRPSAYLPLTYNPYLSRIWPSNSSVTWPPSLGLTTPQLLKLGTWGAETKLPYFAPREGD